MSKRDFSSVVLVSALSIVSLCGVQRAQAADAAARPLSCAVAGTGSPKRSKALCQAVGRALKRPIALVDDGARVRRGEAVHIVQGDVDWLVILLRDGQTRAFTRVSATDAAGREGDFLGRASRVLIREQERTQTSDCLKVEPNGQVPMLVAELAYPWVELKQCRAHHIDVVDPWWGAPHASAR